MRGDKPIYLDWTGLRLGPWVVELKCQVKVRERITELYLFPQCSAAAVYIYMIRERIICAICISVVVWCVIYTFYVAAIVYS